MLFKGVSKSSFPACPADTGLPDFLSFQGWLPTPGGPTEQFPHHSDSLCVLLERYCRWPLYIQTLFGELRINIWAS